MTDFERIISNLIDEVLAIHRLDHGVWWFKKCNGYVVMFLRRFTCRQNLGLARRQLVRCTQRIRAMLISLIHMNTEGWFEAENRISRNGC